MLSSLLKQLIQRSGGSHREFAKEVGLTGSTLSHLLSGDPHYSIGIEPCLRIAEVSRISASKVLRAAGKGHVADLIERLYGPAAVPKDERRPASMTPEDVRFMRKVRSLDEQAQRALVVLLDHALSAKDATRRKLS